ncbi:hypothetical protein K461DRAFT_277016 [Myriangium duriaei CBS 260.36]|uniref:Uncharacterized protein n=1 Tax=Myriangium duriaei CBS 260.36 TaxID=1168546 RepID=A0A9P4J1W2_9PEZI|nr:hypothetical protein K461DRAFT_277016 [Myriangium duriaei CBS 260.36]
MSSEHEHRLKPVRDDSQVIGMLFIQGLNADPYHTWVYHAPVTKRSISRLRHGSDSRPQQRLPTWLKTVDGADQYLFWITELLPKYLPRARIAIHGYETKRRSANLAQGLRECGDRLLQHRKLH